MLGIRTKTGLIAAALCGFTHVAWADGVTIGGDLTIDIGPSHEVDEIAGPTTSDWGIASISFSNQMLRAFDATQIGLTPNGSGSAPFLKWNDGTYAGAVGAMGITSYIGVPGPDLIEASTQGNGLTLSTPNGSFITLMDWTINTQTLEIRAEVTGSNGLAPIDSLLLWQAKNAAPSSFQLEGEYRIELTGLAWSVASRQAFTQALGLDQPTETTWNAVQDAGTMSLQVGVASTPVFPASSPLPSIPAIPEPSTYALMGLGLVGIGFAARRRQAH